MPIRIQIWFRLFIRILPQVYKRWKMKKIHTPMPVQIVFNIEADKLQWLVISVCFLNEVCGQYGWFLYSRWKENQTYGLPEDEAVDIPCEHG